MKVKIYTYAYNRPDFIPLQLKSFSVFLKDDFEYIVFNNAATESDQLKINESCGQLGVRCIDVEEQDHQTANDSHASALEWSFHRYIKYDQNTLTMILDHDMFLINEFSLNDFLNNYDVAAVAQCRGHVNYLWAGIMFFNMNSLPNKDEMNFMCGIVEGFPVDVGGNLYYWLKKSPMLKLRETTQSGQICSENNNLELLPDEVLNDYADEYRFELYEKAFLHYGAGSNWDWKSDEYHKKKTNLLEKFLKNSMERKI